MTVDLISLDPGLVCPALAYFDHGRLIATRYLLPNNSAEKQWAAIARNFWLVRPYVSFDDPTIAYERPKIYKRRKVNQNDLLDLTGVAGAVVALFEVEISRLNQQVVSRAYLPSQWKGSMEKKACNRLVKSRLSPDELAAINLPRASLAHNVWDAVGIGLKHLGRFGPHTKPRNAKK